jgi:hypothetical protein
MPERERQRERERERERERPRERETERERERDGRTEVLFALLASLSDICHGTWSTVYI